MRRGIGMALVLGLVLAAPAGAAPLARNSPLYSTATPLVDENPDVTADYQGTITEKVAAPEVESSGSSHSLTSTLEWGLARRPDRV